MVTAPTRGHGTRLTLYIQLQGNHKRKWEMEVHVKSEVECKTDVTPVHQEWSHIYFALSHGSSNDGLSIRLQQLGCNGIISFVLCHWFLIHPKKYAHGMVNISHKVFFAFFLKTFYFDLDSNFKFAPIDPIASVEVICHLFNELTWIYIAM